MASYDQWKTASPYDDEMDIVEEIEKQIRQLRGLLKSDWDNLEQGEIEYSLERSIEVMEVVADWISEYV